MVGAECDIMDVDKFEFGSTISKMGGGLTVH